MSTVGEAMEELRNAFLDITPPDGVSLGERVWAWPVDRAEISYNIFPFIICAQVVNEPGNWNPMSQGVGYHHYPVEILICLNNWSSRDDITAEDEEGAQRWLLAAATVFFRNRGLGGAVLDLGGEQALFTSQIGHLGWLANQEFFGVYLRSQIHQIHSLPSI
jgi:hypothetical protein